MFSELMSTKHYFTYSNNTYTNRGSNCFRVVLTSSNIIGKVFSYVLVIDSVS